MIWIGKAKEAKSRKERQASWKERGVNGGGGGGGGGGGVDGREITRLRLSPYSRSKVVDADGIHRLDTNQDRLKEDSRQQA